MTIGISVAGPDRLVSGITELSCLGSQSSRVWDHRDRSSASQSDLATLREEHGNLLHVLKPSVASVFARYRPKIIIA